MLYWFETYERVKSMPFQQDFRRWMERMKPEDLAAIHAGLNDTFDKGDIHTAGWIPGDDWSGTVFSPIYHDAAKGNYDLSAKIFGLIVFNVFFERSDAWVTGRFEKDGIPIKSRTYFKPENPAVLRG